MKNIELKKSGDSWMVRETHDISGSTVWRTSYYHNLCRAVVSYIKLLVTPEKTR